MFLRPFAVLAAVCTAGAVAVPTAFADDQPAAPPAAWSDGLKFSGHVEAGVSFNPDSPSNGIDFGHLFDDRDNTVELNQVLLTYERDLDPKNPNFDIGFKLQGMYGSDARYTHFLGELDRTVHDRNQFDIVEANLTAHLPILTDGGIDVKIGQYPTPIGAEVIDASGNQFYSKSYIFNFGIPLKHTGGYAVVHTTDWLDLWAGVDSGVNTSLGSGDNNNAAAGLGGFQLNLLDGNLTILTLAHIGPENGNGPLNAGLGVNNSVRQIYDSVITWKVNDKLTSTTELNYIRDDLFHATAEGAATYLAYTLTDQLTIGGRAEVFRDDQGFFVYAFPSSSDFVNSEYARPNLSYGNGKTTYGEVTLGATYKLPNLPKAIDGAMVRPELRVDDALSGHPAFNDGTNSSQVTLAVDFVLPFAY